MTSWKFGNHIHDFFRPVKRFIISLGLIMSAAIVSIYAGIYYSHQQLIIQTVKNEAASYYDLIIKAREWNAMHSGVYVKKAPGVTSDQFLKKLGINPDIKTASGTVLTLQNPAMMTKEISKLTSDKEGATFHLTSLRLVNPANAPDTFERSALTQFEHGSKSVWEIDDTGKNPRFRLMKPLVIQEGCLNCHKGYHLGDIRGGISISIPLGSVERELRTSKIRIAIMSVLTIVFIMATLYVMSSRMLRQLNQMQEQLIEASTTDSLTGAFNRRFVMERLAEELELAKRSGMPLSVIIMDIDHFKKINDAYGHLFGDKVLKTLALRVKSGLRTYDIFGRFGGEEFIVVAPNTSMDDAVGLAGRIARLIRTGKITEGTNEASVTASLGVSVMDAGDASPEDLLHRADNALYKAKELGRDRVVS